MTTEQTITIKSRDFMSVADAVYQVAIAEGVTSSVARYINETYGADWFKKEDAKHKEEIRAAALIRKGELTPPRWYRIEGADNMIPLDAEPDQETKDSGKCFQMSIAYATTVSQQSINGIKHRENYKKLLQDWRRDGMKYASGIYNKVLRACKDAAKDDSGEGQKRETAAHPMGEKIGKVLSDLRKSNKVARDSRHDDTALSDIAFDSGIAAFWLVAGKPELLEKLKKLAK